VDHRATDEMRASMRRNRKAPKLFDFGERKAGATPEPRSQVERVSDNAERSANKANAR